VGADKEEFSMEWLVVENNVECFVENKVHGIVFPVTSLLHWNLQSSAPL
jgi:hypothetical protein